MSNEYPELANNESFIDFLHEKVQKYYYEFKEKCRCSRLKNAELLG